MICCTWHIQRKTRLQKGIQTTVISKFWTHQWGLLRYGLPLLVSQSEDCAVHISRHYDTIETCPICLHQELVKALITIHYVQLRFTSNPRANCPRNPCQTNYTSFPDPEIIEEREQRIPNVCVDSGDTNSTFMRFLNTFYPTTLSYRPLSPTLFTFGTGYVIPTLAHQLVTLQWRCTCTQGADSLKS